MARGVNPKVTYPYVLKEDRELPKEQQSVFHIRAIPAKVQFEMQDKAFAFSGNLAQVSEGAQQFNEVQYRSGTLQLDNLLNGLVRVENYSVPTPLGEGREKCSPLAWGENVKTREKKLELLDCIQPKHRTEVAQAIQDMSTTGEEDSKNSEGQS